MFGYGKKNKEKNTELLEPSNIRLNCRPGDKETVIREVGRMLCESGCVDESYIEAMLRRELTFPHNNANGNARPHGGKEGKKIIIRSGIADMVFPDGTDWGGEMVKLVIGIAGAGEEHLEILSVIAQCLADPDDVNRITRCSAQEIYTMFTGKGCS